MKSLITLLTAAPAPTGAQAQTPKGRERAAQGHGRGVIAFRGEPETGLGGMQINLAAKLAKLDAHHPPLQIAEAPQGFGVEAQQAVAGFFDEWHERQLHI